MALLASLCVEVVEYWNDLAVYFGTHRPNVTSEGDHTRGTSLRRCNDASAFCCFATNFGFTLVFLHVLHVCFSFFSTTVASDYQFVFMWGV